ncbi:MAG: D-aminoacyl-tRNA deacylase [Deltaproteobacteria bacterium]|nr:D-aminoacyl-tRNA deacylase [Deltaproteobacteria bacterium]
MRILLQRVEHASVSVDDETVAAIGPGLCVFLGVGREDTEHDSAFLADKLLNLRIFPDEAGKFDRSVTDIGGEILVVSQFTLYGDTRKGRRPSLTKAAVPEDAERLYRDFVERLTVPGGPRVCTGTFQAYMKVSLVNDGPVTFLIDSAESRKKP